MPNTMDPKDVELLNQMAAGNTYFRPMQDEPSDSPRWLRQLEQLERLRSQGLIRMPEPERFDNKPGNPAGVGPCELTADGRDVLNRFKP